MEHGGSGELKMGQANPLKWAEESRIEMWAESPGPRSPGLEWLGPK